MLDLPPPVVPDEPAVELPVPDEADAFELPLMPRAEPLALLLTIWHTLQTSAHPDSNQHYIIFLVALTWSSDSGAYFLGRMIGKHKMCPTISPGKTWEGMAGGIVMCIGVAVLMARLGLPVEEARVRYSRSGYILRDIL